MLYVTEPSAAAHEEALLVVHSSSSEADEASPSALASACPEAEEVELQVQNWCFSELHWTNLAALREVDVCIPFRLPALADAHWNKLIQHTGAQALPGQACSQVSANAQAQAAQALPGRRACRCAHQPRSCRERARRVGVQP